MLVGESYIEMLMETANGVNINSLEGRAWVANNAKSIWAKTQDEKTASQILKLTANFVLLTEHQLSRLWEKPPLS